MLFPLLLSAVDFNLNDQDRQEAQDYYHEGMAERAKNEACADDPSKLKVVTFEDGTKKSPKLMRSNTQEACLDQAASAFGKQADDIIEIVAKAYSLFGMVGVMSQGASASGGSLAKKSDLCFGIASAAEMISMMTSQIELQKIQMVAVEEGQFQTESLKKVKRSHNSRFKTFVVLASGWGATSACYATTNILGHIGSMPTPGEVVQKGLKLAMAGFLTTFYVLKAKKSKEYANKLDEIIASLPKKGDCNPHTQRHCYCEQPETQNDTNYCLPSIYKNRLKAKNDIVACINNTNKIDESCDCIATKSCLSTVYRDLAANNIDLNRLIQSGRAAEIMNATNGSFNANAALDGAQNNLKMAMGALRSKNLGDVPPLNAQQTLLAKKISSMGIPLQASAKLVSLPKLKGAPAQFSKSLQNRFRFEKASLKNSKSSTKGEDSKVVYFGGAKRPNKNSRSSIDFSRFGHKKKKKKTKKHKNVLHFQRAHNKAQINNEPRRNIFKILSLRYQRLYWSSDFVR